MSVHSNYDRFKAPLPLIANYIYIFHHSTPQKILVADVMFICSLILLY